MGRCRRRGGGGGEHNEEAVADEDSGGRAAHVLVVFYSPVAGVGSIPTIKAHRCMLLWLRKQWQWHLAPSWRREHTDGRNSAERRAKSRVWVYREQATSAYAAYAPRLSLANWARVSDVFSPNATGE